MCTAWYFLSFMFVLKIFAAPWMRFPMDVTDVDTLVGHLNGILEGGVSMAPGAWGNALYIDGQPGSRVEHGVHTEGCFFDPDQCDQGITLSLWLKFQGRPSGIHIIFDNGACTDHGIGFCIYVIFDVINMRIQQRSLNTFYEFSISDYTDYKWYHLSFTHLNDDTNVYINGCKITIELIGIEEPRNLPYNEDTTFHIGDWFVNGGLAPHVVIDELLVWGGGY